MSTLLRTRLERLQKSAPKRSSTGQLYSKAEDKKARYRRVNLYCLFLSDEGTHMVLPHMFESKKHARTPEEWFAWFGAKVHFDDGRGQPIPPPVDEIRLTHIHRTGILPGLAIRTGKTWSVQRIIGWVGSAKYKSRAAAVGKRRNQAKHKRKSRG